MSDANASTPELFDDIVANSPFLSSHRDHMRARVGNYDIPEDVVRWVGQRQKQEKAVHMALEQIGLGPRNELHIRPSVWRMVEKALFQADTTTEESVKNVCAVLGLPSTMFVSASNQAGVWQEERHLYKFSKTDLQIGDSAKNLRSFQHGSVVTCDYCGITLAGRQGELSLDVATSGFYHDPEAEEDYCVSCSSGGDTGNCNHISNAAGVMAIYGEQYRSYRFDTYLGSLQCYECNESLCDENGCVSKTFYEAEEDAEAEQRLWCEKCHGHWYDTMPLLCIRVSLDGASRTIGLYRKSITFSNAVRFIVGMKWLRARAHQRLYGPSSGKGAQLAKESFEAAVAAISIRKN